MALGRAAADLARGPCFGQPPPLEAPVFRVGGILFQVGGDTFRVDCGTFRVGGGVFRVGGGIFRVGGGVFRVGGDVFRVGGGTFQVGDGVSRVERGAAHLPVRRPLLRRLSFPGSHDHPTSAWKQEGLECGSLLPLWERRLASAACLRRKIRE